MSQSKILVIDDEEDFLCLVEEILSGEGYEVVTAVNGKEALKTLEKIKPDVIILDIAMPKMGGIAFYHSIASRVDGKPRYPIIVMTGRNEFRNLFHDLPVSGFMTKPFKVPELLELIRSITEKKTVSHLQPSFAGEHETAETPPKPHEEAMPASHLPPSLVPHHFTKSILVQDVMSRRVITARAASSTLGMHEQISDKLSAVVEKLREYHIRHIPVVDNRFKLVGLVSEDNLLRHITPKRTEEGYYFEETELDSLILEHVMTPNPVTVRPEDPLYKAVSIMAREKYGALPVVDSDNTLVGILSQIDILKVMRIWLE
ncbi:MAG TPA: CBS domain-containing protein [Verrucomicrobiae bacterium]|nr:CBS domain-containing protein [Verrucomicrobiae bacterium]